ncbi:RES family NAD+ phosphorylase [Georgenia subflava]|uniref:RES family NAD+ phosphorylase n=1 Tax=Georgenia subflava TaxID=1622177 RepID=UPI00186AC36E|nr:RES family NAD+ phosphorylase [Georgenia subflava]
MSDSSPPTPDPARFEVAIPPPPHPFEPLIEVLPAGSRLFRSFSAAPDRHATTFNPGYGGPHRFSFFGDPTIAVLYAAQTEIAAVCESLLHDVPLFGGRLMPEQYERTVVAALDTTRELRLAAFHGVGLRRLGVEPAQLTSSPASTYGTTVAWGEAAHAAGFDGVVWMSARCNTDRAYVLFGDRVHGDDLRVVPDYGRVFTTGPDRDWLVDLCAFMKVDVLTRAP